MDGECVPGNDELIAEKKSKNGNENDNDKEGAGENGDDDEDEVGAENERGPERRSKRHKDR